MEQQVSNSKQPSSSLHGEGVYKQSLSFLEEKAKQKYFSNERVLRGQHIFERLFFTWIKCVLQFGNSCKMEAEDLPQLDISMDPIWQYQSLKQNLRKQQKSHNKGVTLLKSILKTYRGQIIKIMLMALLTTVINISLPFITYQILIYIQSNVQNRLLSDGLFLCSAIISLSLGKIILQSQLYYKFGVFGFALSNTLTLLIYQKSLKSIPSNQQRYSTSAIVNFSQADAQRMTSIGPQLTSLLFTPFQICIGFWSIYSYIGISFMVGIAIMVLIIFLTFFMSKKMVKINEAISGARDERMKATQQILNAIKFIKINSLQNLFFKKVDTKRQNELLRIRKRSIFQILLTLIYQFSCPIIVFLTFLVCIQLKSDVQTYVLFTTVMIFNNIQSPFRQLPSAFSNVIQMKNSIERIQEYLLSEQRPVEKLTYSDDNQIAIRIKNGCFRWKESDKTMEKKAQSQLDLSCQNRSQASKDINEDQSHTTLRDINFSLNKNKFYIILGDTASGKSSLFSAILGQMQKKNHSQIQINGSISYCAQSPYIMNGTVRENILFKLPYNKDRFQEAIYYSCLQKDLNLLADGEMTQIGEKGNTLSGGQKARIALARAIYSHRDIFLLDDVLSSVDNQTAQFLVKNTFKRYLSNKTVILITHAKRFCELADQIIILSNGFIVIQGPFDQIRTKQQFIQVFEDFEGKQQAVEKIDKQRQVKLQQMKLKQTLLLLGNKNESALHQQSLITKNVKALMIPEDHNRGGITFQLIKQFINLNGGASYLIAICTSMIGWLIFSIGSNIQLENWCKDAQHRVYYLYGYIMLAIFASSFAFLRSYTLISSGFGLGRKVHRNIIKSLLYASLHQFHRRVPIGRIINRLTKDMRQLDETIISALNSFLITFFSFIGILSICIYSSSLLIIFPAIIVIILCEKLRRYYMKTQRQVIRIEGKTNSPIASGFISAIQGLTTIRAYEMQNQFFNDQLNKVQINKRARVTRQALESWFAFRLSLFSLFLIILSIYLSLANSLLMPAHMGILLIFAFHLNDEIISLTFSWTNLENKMISIQRIFNFAKIQPEKGYQNQFNQEGIEKDSTNIFQKGQIQFKNVSLQYRPDFPFSLKGIDFKINVCDKIGIVGRTGAGKSSIFNLLTRIVDPIDGEILIDGKNYLTLNIKDLRSSLTVIDQQSLILEGTLRQNLTFNNQHDDKCNLYEKVMENGGLDAKFDGNTLSAGQKQMICICRACLRQNKIILIDEATSNIDESSDKLIRQLIDYKFKNCTILMIAHRLSTLFNCDKIMIIDEGKVVQFVTNAQFKHRKLEELSQLVIQKNMQ